MQVNNISIHSESNNIIVSANVEFRNGKPEKMYFSTDQENQSLVSADYSPFLAAVLLPCMKTGEDITIEGSVSKKLLENTNKIMDLVESWNVGLKKVKIQAGTALRIKPKGSQTEIASFFSAGVDSFYTYLKHKNKTDKITNLILVHGFDIPLSNKSFFAETRQTVEKIAEEEKVKAVIVETNAGEIIEKKLIWDFAHGGALAAVGLFLGKLDSIFIPAGLREDEIFPYGTHPDLDKLWSTENTTFVHDGTEHNRLGKIMNSVGKSDLALKYLRVCSQNIKGKYNCSRCYKCLQTMIELVCADSFDKAKTFDKLDLNSVRKMYYDYALKYNLQGEANLAVLKQQNREPELQKAIEYSLEQSKKTKLTKKLYNSIAYLDRRYNNRRLYMSVIKLTADRHG